MKEYTIVSDQAIPSRDLYKTSSCEELCDTLFRRYNIVVEKSHIDYYLRENFDNDVNANQPFVRTFVTVYHSGTDRNPGISERIKAIHVGLMVTH